MQSIDPPMSNQSDKPEVSMAPAVDAPTKKKFNYLWIVVPLLFFVVAVGISFTKNSSSVQTVVIDPTSLTPSPTKAIPISVMPTRSSVVYSPFSKARNDKRKSDATSVINAVKQYSVDNQGEFPKGITENAQRISKKGLDICSAIVPMYLPAFPHDELLNITSGKKDAPITDCNSDYDSGYTIQKVGENQFTVTAPLTEEGPIISVTK